MDKFFSFLKQPKYQVLIIILLTALAYSNIFQNSFLLDDETFIINWEQVKSFNYIPELLRGEVPEIHRGVYRPVRSLLYLVYQQVYGVSPFGYHLHGLVVHLLSAVLVYLIIQSITKKRNAAFLGSLLFGLHPVHTESITYISASMEMTGVVFSMTSFWLYLFQKNNSDRKIVYLLSLFFAFLAFFTYEMTLTLPLLIILYDLCFLNKKNFWQRVKVYTPYFGGVAAFLFIRLSVLNIPVDRGDYLGFSFYHTMLMMTKVMWKYIWLLISPINVSYIHDLAPGFESFMTYHSNVPAILSQTIFDWDVLAAIFGLIILGVIAIKACKKLPLVTFCLGWFFIGLIPVSYIFPQGIAIADKYLYTSSVGFVLLLAWGINYLLELKSSKFVNQYVKLDLVKRIIMGAFLLITGIYFVLTYQQNMAWRDEFAFWHKLEAQHSNSALTMYTLGVVYGDKEDFVQAEKYYQKTIALDPRFWEARYNLGNIYTRENKTDLATEEYRAVTLINPDFTAARDNLGKLSPASSASDSAQTSYSDKNLSFSYPSGWKVSSQGKGIRVKGEEGFVMEIELDKRGKDQSIDDYLQHQTITYGNLINQGLAEIPNVDSAYVKVFNDNRVQNSSADAQSSGQVRKMQFFLFKGDKVIKILVYPADSPLMKEFDKIVGSINF